MRGNGVYTSEFWLTLVTLIVSAFLIYTGRMTVQESVVFAGLAASYNIGRGLAKTEVVPPQE